MKKSTYTFLKDLEAAFCLLIAGLVLFSCEQDKQEIPLETLEFSVSDTPLEVLNVNETRSVLATPTPQNVTEKIVWTSADPEIAQVQSNEPGLVAGIIGLKAGETLISASTTDGRISQSFPVKVLVKINQISFSEDMILLSPDQGYYKIIFDPENATIQDLIWNSSVPEVASVDPSTGYITAGSPGSTVITATTVQGEKSASIEVFVSGTPPVFGKDYCSITADNVKGSDYSADQVATSGAVQNLSHFNQTVPPTYYKHYEGEKLVVKKGEPFTLNVVQSNDWSRTLVWIDWNKDKDFADEGERVAVFGDFFTDSGSNPGPFNKVITVSDDAVPGVTRMRVITGDAWTLNLDIESIEPCGIIPYGTIKDFDVEIVN